MDRLPKRQKISEPFRYSQSHAYNGNHYKYVAQPVDGVDDSAPSITENYEEVTTYGDSEPGSEGDEFSHEHEQEEDEEEDDNIYSADEDVEDENAGLAHLRAQASQKLKSRFESIFKKYEKDFSGVGDEIDLETGEIVVNNGHLVDMQDETDAGQFGRGEGILRALTVEPTDQYIETDDTDESYPSRAQVRVQVVDSEEDGNEDEDGMIVDESEASFAVGEASTAVEKHVHIVGSNSKKPSPTNAQILEQFGLELGPQIIMLLSTQQQAGGSYVEPAWRIPDSVLPSPYKRQKLVSLLPLDISTEDRSPSPISRKSIWAPEGRLGRPKTYATFPRRTNDESRINRAPYSRYKPSNTTSRIPSSTSPRRGPGQPRKRHSTESVGSHSKRPRSTTRLDSPALDTFEDGIGQILGESSQNLQPSLIRNSRSFRLRPRGPALRDPESISWTEAVAAVEKIDPHLYAGLVEDAERDRLNRQARSYSVDSLSSTSSFGDDVASDRPRYPNEDAVPRTAHPKDFPTRKPERSRMITRKSERSRMITRKGKLTLGQLTQNAVLDSILDGVKDPEQMIQYVGTTIEGIQHQIAAIPCPHMDCASCSMTLYRCQRIGKEHTTQITNHLRDVHDTTPYPCQESGCHRKGGKGYFRSRDLARHVRTDHPGIAAYDRLRPRIGEATFNLYDCYAAERSVEKSFLNRDQERRGVSSSADQSPRRAPISTGINPRSTNPAPIECYDEDELQVVDTNAFNSDLIMNVIPRTRSSGNMGEVTPNSSIKNTSPAYVRKTPRNIRFLIPASDDNSSALLSSAPASQEQSCGNLSKAEPKETFSRNKIDPAYEFSDEEPPQPQNSDSQDVLKQVKQYSGSQSADGTDNKNIDQRLTPAEEYKYPCRYKDNYGCKRMFREHAFSQRHSKSHGVQEVINCESPGCSRWFSSENAYLRHVQGDHRKKGMDCSQQPEYLSEVEVEDNDQSFDSDVENQEPDDLPPPHSSSPIPDRVPKNLVPERTSPAAKINTLQLFGGEFYEDPKVSDAEMPATIEELDNQRSRSAELSPPDLPKKTHPPTAVKTPPSTQPPVQVTNVLPVVIPATATTDFLSIEPANSSAVLHQVPSQYAKKKPSLRRADILTGPSASPCAAQPSNCVKSSKPTASSSGTLAKSNKKPSSQDMATARSTIVTASPNSPNSPNSRSPKEMMPPPPLPTRHAESTKTSSRRLSMPHPKQQTSLRKQVKGARNRASLPSMAWQAASNHSTPRGKIRCSIEYAKDYDLDELDPSFDSPALMRVRADSVAPSSAAKKLLTPIKHKYWRSGNRGTPLTPDPLEVSTPSRHSSLLKKRETHKNIVRLSDISGDRGVVQNHFTTPVKRKRSMLAMDYGKLDGDLVETPGGTLRRCGKEGFSCDRDFCFTCI